MVYRRGRIWWMRFTHRGQQVRRSTKAIQKSKALEFEREVRYALDHPSQRLHQESQQKTFNDLMDQYLTEHSKAMKRPSSHRRDLSLAAHLREAFGPKSLEEISPKWIVAYKSQRRQEGAASRTINLELSLMRHAFNKALKEYEWVDKNPVAQVSHERVTLTMERWLREDEEERLLACSPSWLRDVIVFAINTGLRQGEILNLQWPRVDMFRKAITIVEQKNQAIDTLPLNRKALEVIIRRTKLRPNASAYVFSTSTGTKHNARNLLRRFYQACQEADVQSCRFHDLRHTFATRLIQRGVDLYTVEKLGRWKSLSMVQRYAHHNPESLRPGVNQLDSNFTNSSTN